jgi:hypothetical protein
LKLVVEIGREGFCTAGKGKEFTTQVFTITR